jgi:hypothetical protein
MSCKVLMMLFLTSQAQEQTERRPMPAPPALGKIVNVRVMIAGKAEIRQITCIPAAADDDNDKPLALGAMRFNILTSALASENFDCWLFGEAHSEADRHRHLDEILRSKVDTATLAHQLTDSQRAKLRLAGRGDIKRYFDQVEERRRDFEKDRHHFRTGLAALERLAPLTQVYREGAFGDGSLFAKTLSKINDDQKAVR